MEEEERKPIRGFFLRAFTEGNMTPAIGIALENGEILVVDCQVRKITKKDG